MSRVHLCVATILVCSIISVLADTYYVTPTPSTPCPEGGDLPCFTLSQYARNYSSNFAYNTTIILLPGNHSLEFEFSVTYIASLTMTAETTSHSDTVINCNQSANFMFENISVVNIRGLILIGCVNNKIDNVEQFTLEDSSLQGHSHFGTGLELNVSSAYIVSSSFSFFTTLKVHGQGYNSFSGGGALIIFYSENLVISHCTFANNSVSENYYGIGGAVLINPLRKTFLCVASIESSSFVRNTVTVTDAYSAADGGALWATMCAITINNSLFTDNGVVGEHASGGAVWASKGNVTIADSTFINNTVDRCTSCLGGAVATTRFNTVMIYNSKFIDNRVKGDIAMGGAFLAYSNNTNFVVIHNSTFYKNIATGKCLCLGGAMTTDHLNVSISDSEFKKNSATLFSIEENSSGAALYSSNGNLFINNCIFSQNIVTGYGAVLDVFSSNLTSYGSLKIIKNTAETFVMFAANSTLYFSGNTTISNNNALALEALSCHSITFTGHTNIMNNTNGVLVSEFNPGLSREAGTVTVANTALLTFQGTINFMYNTAIHGGAISATQSTISLSGNITVAYNKAIISGGGFYALQSYLINTNDVFLIENEGNERGGGIHAVGSTFASSDGSETYIAQNKAERGGGACLESNSKLYVLKGIAERVSTNQVLENTWIRLEFIENLANYGGAVYIGDDANSVTCSTTTLSGLSTVSNECFIQGLTAADTGSPLGLDELIDGSLSAQPNQETFNRVNTYFSNNTATVAGNLIYGGLLDRCTINAQAEILFNGFTFDPSGLLSAALYLLIITDIAVNDYYSITEISSDPVRVCFCRDNLPDCSYQPQPLSVNKGQKFNVSLVAVDQVSHAISNTIINGFIDLPAILGEGQSVQQTNNNGTCTTLTYSILSMQTGHLEEKLYLYADGPCESAGISLAEITVNIAPCPVGFFAEDIRCECDPFLIDKGYIFNCSIGDDTVLQREGVWFTHSNVSGYLHYRQCPFDYCRTSPVSVNLNVPNGSDAKCAFNRSGKLCGSCKDGFSLSLGSSRCLPACSNNWLALLIVFAIAGVALIVFILKCNLTVAVGTINGLIFYANILTIDRATFFPFDTPNFFTVFISWLNLDFGFVTCFYDGMDGYAKTWLQLAFPLYIILIVTVGIIASEYSTRVAKLFTRTNPVATLATLILLSYTKSLRVIIAAFSLAKLEYSEGSHEIVWLTDANIRYFEGKHIPLFLVALLILLLGVVYTFFLFSYQWLLRYSYRRGLRWINSARLYPFMDAYHAPYTKKRRYWTGLLLLARALLYVAVVSNVSGDTSINIILIIFTVATIALLKIFLPGRDYQSLLLEVIEISFIFNLLIFTIATYVVIQIGGNQAVLAYISSSIAFITFLIILLYHTYEFLLPRKVKNKLDSIRKRRKKSPVTEENAYANEIATVQENKCTYSVVDPPKTFAKIGAIYKAEEINGLEEEKANKNEPMCPSSEEVTQSTVLTSRSSQSIEPSVDIELEELPSDSKKEQNSLTNVVEFKCRSPTLSSVKLFVDPYIGDIEQRGTERETEINELIDIVQ